MNSHLVIILGMAVVTYIPRIMPLFLLKEMKLTPQTKLFLQLIPYTSLSILIIRGIITSSPSQLPAAVVGIGIAGIFSYWKGNLVAAV